jgi:sulfatase maturation enzyme AslB (radical SAM superfamily)
VNNNSITIGGNNAGVVAIGNSNCSISNTVSISSDSAQKQLEDLLNQLRKHIQAEAMLSAGDKQDLLEQTDALAKAKQLSESAEKESVARKARKIFEATLKALPATAVLVESCNKILPVVLKLLGVQLP